MEIDTQWRTMAEIDYNLPHAFMLLSCRILLLDIMNVVALGIKQVVVKQSCWSSLSSLFSVALI